MTVIYGHRGAKGERPENTIEAFLYAGSLGVAGVECDIALTSDFVPVMHHDPDILPGVYIRDLSFEELHERAPHIPTLAQALDAAPKMEWLIEIKTFPDGPEKSLAPKIMTGAVLAVLEDAGKLRQACILAFDWRILSIAARYAPSVRRVCLTAPETEKSRKLWWGEAITEAAMPNAVAQSQAYAWAPFHATLTSEQIEQAHRLGLKIFPWTVNEPAEFLWLAPQVDGIITDFPSQMAL